MPALPTNPILFTIPDDGEEPVTLSRAWLTDVMQSSNGKEQRSALRVKIVRTLAYTAKFRDNDEAGRFRAFWYAAPERLRFIVPIWCNYAMPVTIVGSVLTGSFAYRGLVAGEQAVLWTSPTRAALVTLDAVADGEVTLSAPIDPLEWVPGIVRLIPVMTAWLDPATMTWETPVAETVPLVFREELPKVVGLDPELTGEVDQVPVSMTFSVIKTGQPGAGRKFRDVEIIVKDAAGVRIPRPPLVWTVTPVLYPYDASVYPSKTRVTFPENGQKFHLETEMSEGSYYRVHVDCGALSLEFDVNAVA